MLWNIVLGENDDFLSIWANHFLYNSPKGKEYRHELKKYVILPMDAVVYCRHIEDDEYMHKVIVRETGACQFYVEYVREDNEMINERLKPKDYLIYDKSILQTSHHF